jgi:hypothetical protein
MKTETVSRILLTVVVLALLSGIGYWWVNDRPLIFILGVGVALVALWWIWFRSKSLKPQK